MALLFGGTMGLFLLFFYSFIKKRLALVSFFLYNSLTSPD